MGTACSTYGGEESMQGFGDGKLKKRVHFEGLGVDGRVILKRI
jgi:hypothetical protein